MQKIVLFLLFVISTQVVTGQLLKGKVYDSISTVKGIKVYNVTQKRITATDENGNFTIQAKINDYLTFESLFHHPKTVVLKEYHFSDTTIFELKKIINNLEEVEIIAETEQPVFEQETYNIELQQIILEDIKNNPHLYLPEEAYSGGANILGILNLVAKLFKKKNKYRTPVYQPLKYHQIDSLFAESNLFNEKFLTVDLKIPPSKVKMFFDFCDAKGISSEYLKESKQMELLDIFVENSKLFLDILEAYEKGLNNKN